jgi:hypothetical protein
LWLESQALEAIEQVYAAAVHALPICGSSWQLIASMGLVPVHEPLHPTPVAQFLAPWHWLSVVHVVHL